MGPRVVDGGLQQLASQIAAAMVAPDEKAGHRPDAGLRLVLIRPQAREARAWPH